MKVLIVSHNPMTTYHNMGKTILGLFSEFSDVELCQLYIYPSLPDVKSCNSYYRITDKDVLKSLPFKKASGKLICEYDERANKNMFENPDDEKLYRSKNNHHPVIMMARDFLWKLARWWTPELKQWIEAEKPNVIFVAPGRGKFLYDIAEKIYKTYKIPIISYECDDFYFANRVKGFGKHLYRRLLTKKIEHLMRISKHLVAICDGIGKSYNKQFGVPTTTIMTGASQDVSTVVKNSDEPTSITYMGNIRSNRFVSLAQIGKALDNINNKYSKNYKLNIYSGEKDKDILARFNGISSVNFCGYVSGEEYQKVFYSSDILLHTEAFDDENIDKVRNSLSTKIADSLASGIPLFAYGPDCITSIKYLIDNDCAVTAVSEDTLEDKLLSIFTDKNIRTDTAQKGLLVAAKNHNGVENSKRLYALIDSITSN